MNGNGSLSFEKAEAATLRQLLEVFAEAFEDADSYHSDVPSDEYLASLLGSDNFIALVAVSAGTVVGDSRLMC